MTDAHAPYNFVPLQDKDEFVAVEKLPSHDRYHDGRYTGYFNVTLTTETPIFVRGMHAAANYKKGSENAPNTHFFMPDGKTPVIPGATLRGMLRNIVEIVTFGKIHFVSDANAIFFRAVAAKGDDPLGGSYKSVFGQPNPNTHAGKNVRAGYLKRQGDSWYIEKAAYIKDETPFALVPDKSDVVEDVDGILHLTNNKYQVQSFDVIYQMGQKKVAYVASPRHDEVATATLVCTGNMAEGQTGRIRTNRKNFVLVSKTTTGRIPIPKHVVKAYLESITPFQTGKSDDGDASAKSHFNGDKGILQDGKPVFYILNPDVHDDEVLHFGHTPNFRIGHIEQLRDEDGRLLHRAVTPFDRVPDGLRDDSATDYTDAMFGYVRGADARAGRITVSSAKLMTPLHDLTETRVTRILGSPKPTTFQHYLEQCYKNGRPPSKPQLRHYGHRDAKIRGHKLYWRQKATMRRLAAGNLSQADEQKRKNVMTEMHPIHHRDPNKSLSFSFTVHFENLSKTELGALAWAISLDSENNPQARHMLGMGKAFGMGIVKLDAEMHLSDREARYQKLFSGTTWYTPEDDSLTMQAAINEFKSKINSDFDTHPRIQELLTMLQLRDVHEDFIYMQIEGAKGNEYKDRPVLPKPTDVIRQQNN